MNLLAVRAHNVKEELILKPSPLPVGSVNTVLFLTPRKTNGIVAAAAAAPL